jgi:tetratricopeptide (TPR) repeat protein
MMLAQIYGFLEGRPEEGLRLAAELNRTYPENPEVNFLLARIESSSAVEDFEAAAKSYRAVLARAEQDHPHYRGGARYSALAGLARAQQQQWRIEEAIATLTPAIGAGVEKPDWVLPSFLLTRANLRFLLNDPKAEDDTQRVLQQAKWKSWHKRASQQFKEIRARRAAGESAVYAALIPGNRLVAEGKWAEAERFYKEMLAKHPADWQVRYRMAYLELARGQLGPARTRFSDIASSNPGKMPAWVKANALLYLARVNDLQGQRAEAVKLYQRVVKEFENESAAGAARVGLISPYRRVAR